MREDKHANKDKRAQTRLNTKPNIDRNRVMDPDPINRDAALDISVHPSRPDGTSHSFIVYRTCKYNNEDWVKARGYDQKASDPDCQIQWLR